MNDIQNPESSGEEQPPQPGWPAPHGSGGWTPPPPPPGWGDPGWGDPGWRDPGWRDPGAPPPGQQAPGGHHPGGPTPPTWGQPPPYYWQPQGQPGWGGPGGPRGPRGPGGPGGWYGWSPARPRRSLPSAVTALLLVVAVLVGLGIGHGVWSSTHGGAGSASNGQNGSGGPPFGNGNGSGFGNGFGNGSGLGNGSGSLSAPVAAAAHDLVDIDTTLSYQNDAAAGTGIVLSSDGYILTNNHVISGATSIDATDIANGQKYTAAVVGYDRTHDVALLKLANASGLRTAVIGNSSKVAQGIDVVGLGNAGGVGGEPSSAPGQVTALNQSIKAQDESNGTTEQLTGLIQTNCNIQPGDSGGALVDSAGRVIGMDTAASTGFSFETQGNQGFAIPINEAVAIAGQIRGGKASATVHIGKTAFLGVEVDPNPAAGTASGAMVSKAIPGGAADQAGITDGSLITSLGGARVDSSATLTNLISRYHPGDKVQVGWTDANGQTHNAAVTFANGPAA